MKDNIDNVAKCLVQFSTPGYGENSLSIRDNPLLLELRRILDLHKIENNFCDTVLCWGCNDQDWLECRLDMRISWGWCRPIILTEEEWKWFHEGLSEGGILMMMSYIKEDGSFEPYH